MNDIHAQRRDALRSLLTRLNLPGLLVTHPANRYYLSGFELHDPQCNESAGMLVISASGQDWLLTDPRYALAAGRLWPGERLFIYTNPRIKQIRDFLAALHHSPLGFEAQSMSFNLHEQLREGLDLTPTKGLVEGLRMIKDEQEIALLQASCALNHQIFDKIPELLLPGRSERQIAWDVEKLFREHGAEELAFPTIVGVNANAAQPHAVPGHDPVHPDCLVLVDAGARLNAYCSDQSRTFWVGGRPTPEFEKTKSLVRKAQDQAIAALGPGMPASAAYAVVTEFFRDNFVQDHFTHGLGHGIGLETHEAPSLSPHDQTILAPGMTMTVEPGLYHAEWGGIRWEYMVVITADGCRVL